MAFQKLWTNTVWWQNFLYKRSGTDSHYFISPHSKFINLKWNIIFFFFFGLSVTGCKEQSPPKLTQDLLRHCSTTAGGKGKSIRQGSEAKRGRESRMRVEGAPSSSVSSVHRLSCLPGRPNTIFLSLSWEQTLQRELEGLSTFLRLLPRRPNTTAHVSPLTPRKLLTQAGLGSDRILREDVSLKDMHRDALGVQVKGRSCYSAFLTISQVMLLIGGPDLEPQRKRPPVLQLGCTVESPRVV